jgi:hypothetical protein
MDASQGLLKNTIKSHENQPSHQFSHLCQELLQQSCDDILTSELRHKFEEFKRLEIDLKNKQHINKEVLGRMFDAVKCHWNLLETDQFWAQGTGSSSHASHLVGGSGSDAGEK